MPSGPNRVVLHVLAELLAARRLDHLAGKVDVDAVEPALAGIEQQRRGQRLVLAGPMSGTSIASMYLPISGLQMS